MNNRYFDFSIYVKGKIDFKKHIFKKNILFTYGKNKSYM